ncbi:hypothetical protein IAQ61_000903 [Plenodomus lingam]|uniref:uncharacterized protein n=1 Tax=Leptosphaeria maculans TaxID=5022 RepID=UPI00332B909C|nr:hypothetical protein IAQ61_000903 [Plenodomus lingam]
MNADAYLRKQGWKGSGHSLDSTGRGIKKPLLITHKQDQLGLGKKKAAYTTDDQWWMRAYDQSLQSIGTGKEIRTQGINRGGLYGFFVKGEAIQGTIEDSSATTTDASVPPSGTNTPATSVSDTEGASTAAKLDKTSKRKREEADVSETNIKSRKSDKEAKLAKKEAKKMAEVDAATQKPSTHSSRSKERTSVTAKLTKMKPAKKAEYQARALQKGQSLEKYVLRRIQKKDQKRAKYVDPSDPRFFFVDLRKVIPILHTICALSSLTNATSHGSIASNR